MFNVVQIINISSSPMSPPSVTVLHIALCQSVVYWLPSSLLDHNMTYHHTGGTVQTGPIMPISNQALSLPGSSLTIFPDNINQPTTNRKILTFVSTKLIQILNTFSLFLAKIIYKSYFYNQMSRPDLFFPQNFHCGDLAAFSRASWWYNWHTTPNHEMGPNFCTCDSVLTNSVTL